jgi:putative addiction module killer protein
LPYIAKYKGAFVNKAKVRIYRSKQFKSWFKALSVKEKRIIDSRIDTYKKDGLLLKAKILSNNLSLFEFKWNSGMRVYFSLLQDSDGNFMLLLIGGNKNSQSTDIADAKNIIVKSIKGILKKEIVKGKK